MIERLSLVILERQRTYMRETGDTARPRWSIGC